MSSPELLSDKNVSAVKASIVSKSRTYADLDMSLTVHPDFHDIVPLTDTDAVKNSVVNLVMTNYNERPFQPDLAGGIQSLLFEPADKFTIIALRDSIERVLKAYEPRIDQISIAVRDESQYNRYSITIGFRVVGTGSVQTVSLKLQRIR